MFMKLMNGIHMSNLTCQEHFVKKFACSKLNKLRSICVCDFISRKISLKRCFDSAKKEALLYDKKGLSTAGSR